jgi:hypothetical protein
MRQLLLAIVVMLAAVRPAIAQTASLSTLQPGDTIRVWSTAPRLNGQTGIFDVRLRDTLRFTSLSQPMDVPYATLRRIDVRRGLHRSPVRIIGGTLLGAAVGSVVGAFLGVKLECGADCSDDGEWGGLAGFVFGGGAGIIGGGVTGGILAARHRTPRWEGVDLRR